MPTDHSTTSPPNSGAQVEPARLTAVYLTASSSIDILALGFGVLCVDSSEDKTKRLEKVSVLGLL